MTTELSDQQLRALILDQVHDRVDRVPDDLEAELELVDARPAVLPEATPTSFPSVSSLRLAHTMRRDPQLEAGSAVSPARATPPKRTTSSGPAAIPPLAPARTATVIAMPRVTEPAPAMSEAAPSAIAATPAPPVDLVACAPQLFARAPQLVDDTPGRARWFGGRAAAALLVVFLLALATLVFLVR